MMRNNDELAIRDIIPEETSDSECICIDFTVPIIDNFWDMGFALSLGLSLLSRHPELRVKFYSENSVLFEKMLGGNLPNRLSYFDLSDWKDGMRSEIRFNFFGLKITENIWIGYENPKKIINFDYLQFQRGDRGCPGIESIHGTKYEIWSTSVIHFVPSLLPEWGGVVLPTIDHSLRRDNFLRSFELPLEWEPKKWCSVFVYPETLERVLSCTKQYPDWIFLISGTTGQNTENIWYLPFLPLDTYQSFLRLCDANIVRWENSLISAMFAGKPFLWDIYHETNGAHREKMGDFKKYVDIYSDFGRVLENFIDKNRTGECLSALLSSEKRSFEIFPEILWGNDILGKLEW